MPLKQQSQTPPNIQSAILQTTQDSNTTLHCSLEHLPQGVVIIDAELRLAAWNTRYVELFHFPAELMQVGQPIEDLFRYNAERGLLGDGPIEEAIQRRLNHLRSGKAHIRESEKEDGTVLEIRGNSLPEGGFVTSYTDITSYKNATRELRLLADTLEHRVAERTRDLDQARLEAENANRYKTRFIASAVHDLLQPLNAARMFVAMLRKQLHDTDALRIANNIDGALIAEDAILSSLLDISRLESGTLKTQVHHFALGTLLETLASEFGILAQSRGISLKWVPSHAIVYSDETLLRRILQNFLSNAIRYTPRGRVLIGCRRHGNWLRIEVHDQGPGIPESLQSEIFEEFRRLDDGVVNDRGAGLGLAIVERIGRLLNHPIGLRSTLGHGSTFSVSVPLEQITTTHPVFTRTPMPTRELDDDPMLHGCQVWCIDNDPSVCQIIHTLLERWHCAVGFTGSLDEALITAATAPPPELILMDTSIDEHGDTPLIPLLMTHWGHTPRVILMTSEEDPTLRDRALNRGWGFLGKPIRPPALRALMTQTLLRQD